MPNLGWVLPDSNELRWGERRLFKFLPSCWAHALANEGNIQITTIGICRNVYEAGIGRADPSENMLNVVLRMGVTRHIPEGRENDPRFSDWITKEGFRPAPPEMQMPGGLLVMKERRAIEYDVRDDLFVYCVSHYQSRRMEIRYASGDDSWVEIFDPEGFFGAIDAEMLKRGHTPKGLRQVVYRSKYFRRDALPSAPELIKYPGFSSEHEVRACWIPAATARPINRLPLVLPELTKYCRFYRKVMPTQFPLKRPHDYLIPVSQKNPPNTAAKKAA
jgi:hypothetical protein